MKVPGTSACGPLLVQDRHLSLRGGRAAHPAENRSEVGSGVSASMASCPIPQPTGPKGCPRERLQGCEGAGCAVLQDGSAGGGGALEVLPCRQPLPCARWQGQARLGSVLLCSLAVPCSKPLSRVFVTQLPAGHRYVPGPGSGGHVPRAPWPSQHVRCLQPGRELAR